MLAAVLEWISPFSSSPVGVCACAASTSPTERRTFCSTSTVPNYTNLLPGIILQHKTLKCSTSLNIKVVFSRQSLKDCQISRERRQHKHNLSVQAAAGRLQNSRPDNSLYVSDSVGAATMTRVSCKCKDKRVEICKRYRVSAH